MADIKKEDDCEYTPARLGTEVSLSYKWCAAVRFGTCKSRLIHLWLGPLGAAAAGFLRKCVRSPHTNQSHTACERPNHHVQLTACTQLHRTLA